MAKSSGKATKILTQSEILTDLRDFGSSKPAQHGIAREWDESHQGVGHESFCRVGSWLDVGGVWTF